MKNLKTLLFAAIFFALAGIVNAQSVGINSDGSAPNGSAMLDVSSSSKGFLPPRMTYAEKILITSPTAGLMVWCSNCGTFGEMQVYNGTIWTNLIGGTVLGVPPGAPTIGTVTAGNVQASVPFTAPASNGGSTIISYTATSSPGGITGTLTQAGSGTITVTGLTNGTAYTFIVTATNVHGTGAASAASVAVTPATVPGAPAIGAATATIAQASVPFTAPASNGGLPITSYTATSNPGNITGTLNQSGSGAITVTGLTNGTAYTFTVTATNAVGTGAASAASDAVTPMVNIGDSYGGGKVAYILQSGDPGYIAGVQHGLIAATADQSIGIIWAITAYQGTSVPGGTGTAIGTGLSNTDKIIAQNGAGTTYAAGPARAYTGGGYTDWYLPSQVELNKLYLNKATIGGFFGDPYWTSSEYNANSAFTVSFVAGMGVSVNKNVNQSRVRAVRTF